MDDYRIRIYRKYVDVQTRYADLKADILEEYNHRKRVYDLNYKHLLPQDPQASIMELGCGAGHFLKYLSEKGYSNLRGVELSEQQIEVAEKLWVRSFIVHSSITSFLEDTNKIYDLICMFHVLEHFNKQEVVEILELLYKRLKKGGMVIIEVPNAASPLFGGHGRYIDFTHEIGFSVTSLREILLMHGFAEVKVQPIRGVSRKAQLFFKIINSFLHKRFNPDILIEGEIYAIGWKEN